MSFRHTFITDFIYHSNKIEGSRLARKEVEKIINSGSKKNDEVQNSIKAIQHLDQINFPKNIKELVKLHSVLLAHETSKLGIREEIFVVGNATVMNPENIKPELERLFKWFKINSDKLYTPELALFFHYRFEKIHPFKDGNGRIGRLLMNAILKMYNYHPIVIPSSRRVAFFNSFEKAGNGQVNKHFNFMIEQFEKTYSAYVSRIENAISIDEQMKLFFKPL